MNRAQNRKHNKIFIKEQQYASSKTIFQGELVMVIFFFYYCMAGKQKINKLVQ